MAAQDAPGAATAGSRPTGPGLLVTFEGGEGLGKSTQLSLFAEHLRSLGRDVLTVREPGGTAVGDAVRHILLEPGDGMDPVAELLLYEASRAELVAAVMRPALAAGSAVLCDRFTDSTVAYQGFGRGLGEKLVRDANTVATGGLVPDLTLLLVGDVQVGLARATRHAADRIEQEPSDFHRRVAEGFAAIASAESGRVVAVDASGTVAEVEGRIWAVASLHPAVAAWLAAGHS